VGAVLLVLIGRGVIDRGGDCFNEVRYPRPEPCREGFERTGTAPW